MASIVPGEGSLWKSNGAAGTPGYSVALASHSHPLDSLKLLRSLLANADKIHPRCSLSEIKGELEFLARRLSAPQLAANIPPRSSLTSLKHQVKFFVRGLTMPQLTQNWFELWRSPKLSPLLAAYPRVLLKLQRPYSQQGLEARKRWWILRQHYGFATEWFSAAALRQIFTGSGVLLATLPKMESGEFSVRLLYDNLFEKEGELSVVLYDEQKHKRLFALTFCVSSCEPARREIFIGGLQGCKGANARELVVSLTRDMHGLRPKALLLFALQQIAALWHFNRLRAVSNRTRVHRTDSSIKADYDEFWVDSGGRLEADGNFTLPVAFITREPAGIKPNKRALYRRRYAMLDELAVQIAHHANRLEDSTRVSRVSKAKDLHQNKAFLSGAPLAQVVPPRWGSLIWPPKRCG
jgi:uncharacterized protein VirK/YbjX